MRDTATGIIEQWKMRDTYMIEPGTIKSLVIGDELLNGGIITVFIYINMTSMHVLSTVILEDERHRLNGMV